MRGAEYTPLPNVPPAPTEGQPRGFGIRVREWIGRRAAPDKAFRNLGLDMQTQANIAQANAEATQTRWRTGAKWASKLSAGPAIVYSEFPIFVAENLPAVMRSIEAGHMQPAGWLGLSLAVTSETIFLASAGYLTVDSIRRNGLRGSLEQTKENVRKFFSPAQPDTNV